LYTLLKARATTLRNEESLLTKAKAEWVLVLTVMATSASFLFMKLGLSLAPFNLLALRFLIAFAAAFFLCRKRMRRVTQKTVFVGALLGLLMFTLIAAQLFGLSSVTTSCASFLSRSTILFVPLIRSLQTKSLPRREVVIGALVTTAGLALMTITSDLSVSAGAWLCLLSGLIYAFHVLIADHYAGEIDLLAAGILELASGGLAAMTLSLLVESPRLPATTEEWGVVLALGLLCSSFGLAVQPVAQQHTTPERYSQIFAMGPAFSLLYGWVFLREVFSMRELAGALLVLAGLLLTNRPHSQTLPLTASASTQKGGATSSDCAAPNDK